QVAAHNLGLLMRKLFGVGKPRTLQGSGGLSAWLAWCLHWLSSLWVGSGQSQGPYAAPARRPERVRGRRRSEIALFQRAAGPGDPPVYPSTSATSCTPRAWKEPGERPRPFDTPFSVNLLLFCCFRERKADNKGQLIPESLPSPWGAQWR